MQTYPGAQFGIDLRLGEPKLYYVNSPSFQNQGQTCTDVCLREFWTALIPQDLVSQRIHIGSREIDIPAPAHPKVYPRHQPSYDPEEPASLPSFGPTTLAPLGYVAHARSGDKSSSANVGFFARSEDQFAWLRSTLTISKVRELLGQVYNGGLAERFELPNIRAVHFLLFDHLDGGVASSSTYDILRKNVAEYLRAKFVDRKRCWSG